MRKFNSNAIYDAQGRKYIEHFYIDGYEVPSEIYFEQLEMEKEIEEVKLQEEQECCDCCCCEEPIIDEIIDNYVERFQEGCNCPVCTRTLLVELVLDILDLVDDEED